VARAVIMQQLYCRFGLESGQWCCNAAAYIEGLVLIMVSAVATQQLLLQVWF